MGCTSLLTSSLRIVIITTTHSRVYYGMMVEFKNPGPWSIDFRLPDMVFDLHIACLPIRCYPICFPQTKAHIQQDTGRAQCVFVCVREFVSTVTLIRCFPRSFSLYFFLAIGAENMEPPGGARIFGCCGTVLFFVLYQQALLSSSFGSFTTMESVLPGCGIHFVYSREED